MSEQDFTLGVRVYYEDTDASGVVYHANYLRYFERARTEWLEARGLDHCGVAADHGLIFTLAELSLRFRQPARLDDRLQISARLVERRRVRMVFSQEIWRDDMLLIEGQFTVASLRADDFRPAPMPPRLLEEFSCT